MDSADRKQLVRRAIEHAVVREPNDLEWLFREGVLTAGPPYTVRLQTPDAVVVLLDHDKEADAFQDLVTDLRQRVRSVRTITTAELQEQLLLALARVAAGASQPISVEKLAQLAAAVEPVVSICELDGIEWLGQPATLAKGLVLGRISDALEQALIREVADPGFTLVADYGHPITEDFQGDRVEPPEPGDGYVGHYPVVLSLATSDRSVANDMIAVRRLAAALGAALWLFSPERGYDFMRPKVRDYARPLDREYDAQFDALIWSGGRWDNHQEDTYWRAVPAESVLAGAGGEVFSLAARTVNEPRDDIAKRALGCLRSAATACDQVDPYDRLLMLVVALEALVVSHKGDQVQTPFVDQLGKLTGWLFEPSDLKHLYDLRSSLAHDGLLDDKQEAKLLTLTHTVAVPCLSVALSKLAELHQNGTRSARDLLSWHATGSR